MRLEVAKDLVVTVLGNLSDCGFFIHNLRSELGFIKTIGIVPARIKFRKRPTGLLKTIQRSRRFSAIDVGSGKGPQNSEWVSYTMVDEKTGATFGITFTNGGITAVPKHNFSEQSLKDYAAWLGKQFKTDVVIEVSERARRPMMSWRRQ